MKIVKLIGFFLLLSSCNQYFGTVDTDYIPQNDVEEVFLNKARVIDSDDDFIIGDTCKIIQRYRPFVELTGVNTKRLAVKHETLINNIARTRNSSNTMLI